MRRIQDKVAIVLGAASPNNMGQTIARLFAKEGAMVMIAGRKAEPLEALAKEIDAAYALCDITRKSDVDALVDATVAKFGGVDIAVNATGWGLVKPFLETTEDELQSMADLQFIGPFLFMQALVRAMTKGGSIIQISSATATIMLDEHAAYMGTKAGTDHVVRCVANEFGHLGIRANSISPGLTESPMTAKAFRNDALVETFRKEYPLGRIGTQDDVAAAALWLAMDESFITGQNLQINGGLTLRRNPRSHEMAEAVARSRASRAASKA
jgi:NAD(P)-dependent dehydrogenase (short-subunit alcohol dehydrogenase family)